MSSPPTSPHRRAFTIIEMLTTVAVLIIVLGLMVSLARYVRDQSANQLTSGLLRLLDNAVRRYADHNGGALPEVEELIPDKGRLPDEPTLHRTARHNNEQFVHALKAFLPPSASRATPQRSAAELPDPKKVQSDPTRLSNELGSLPISIYDEVTLRDAWGDPIVFMPKQHPAIGMASHDHPSFFFSAGPDHKYLTRDDNLYSYEAAR